MPITAFELTNFRIYERVSFQPDHRLTIIIGRNASGKTSLLEAIHLLSTGRTFRKAQFEQILRQGSSQLGIKAFYQSAGNGSLTKLAFSQNSSSRNIRINGADRMRQSDLAQFLPVLVVSPETHFEFQQSARERRAVLDWILFHVEQDFHDRWARYHRVLVQRNSALKNSRYGRATFSWDEELVPLGESLQASRADCLAQVATRFEAICGHLLPAMGGVGLQLDSGWDLALGLARCLINDRERDLRRGYTHSGAHRSDLKILIDKQPSRERASHGQNKLLVIALRLAQIQYFYEISGRECCLLVDDLAAELDIENRRRLISYLADMPVQVIVTATEAENFDYQPWSSHKTFHVKHGTISELVSPEIPHKSAR
jgi:DNA replication and repair protein RecF